MQAIKVLQAILKKVLSITTTTHTTQAHYTLKRNMVKNDKNNCLLPLCRQGTKKEKDSNKV
jgi:hypothetical protein